MRLTKRSNKTVHENGVCCAHYLSKECEERSGFCTDECPWEEAVWSKLADYEDAEEQGLLLRLPVPLGTTVYNTTWWDNEEEKIKVNGATFYRIVHKHKVSKSKFSLLDIKEFGKTVFLTRKEAESALAEKGGAE